MTTHEETTADSCTVACTLPSEEQTARLGELMSGLLARVTEVNDLPNGFSLDFADNSETRDEIDAFVEFEKQCCGFMTYDVATTGTQHVRVTLTGPQGTKEFLSRWLGVAGLTEKKNHAGSTSKDSAIAGTGLKRAGVVGTSAALLGAVCCATPALAAAMAALGLANATGTVAIAIDTAAPLLLAGSAGMFVIGRRRQKRAAEIADNSTSCSC